VGHATRASWSHERHQTQSNWRLEDWLFVNSNC
jgi:hypothetical protein